MPVVTTTAVEAVYNLVIEGGTEHVYAPGDTAALADALRRVISEPGGLRAT